MTENNLIKMGFQRVDDVDGQDPFYYYVYEIGEECCLVSNSNLETISTGWFIELYDIVDGVRFVNARELKTFIDVLERNLNVG